MFRKLAQPGVICALTGPSTLPHLEENLGAAGWTIAPDDLAELGQPDQEVRL
jgi:aryl-alcohol dehydrogenase-like predicted oxidoreductase